MPTVIHATFDGTILRPDEPVPLAPDTRVRLTIELEPPSSTSFFATARRLRLDGPVDGSANLEAYLYGDAPQSDV